jgi:hypothetical protein
MKTKTQQFIEDWGQTTEEVCANLGYDVEDSDDLLVLDYFWEGVSEMWLPKESSLYSKKEQKIADKLRY